MSAKKKTRPASPAPAKTPVVTPTPVAPAPSVAAAASATANNAVVASNPERQRMIANVAMVVVCTYIAALYLLALDQWFKWGIFGP